MLGVCLILFVYCCICSVDILDVDIMTFEIISTCLSTRRRMETRPTRDMTGTTIVVIVRSLAVPMERASWEKPAVPPGSGRSNELLATFAWPMAAPWGPMVEFLRVFQTVCQNPRDAILLTSVNLGCRQPGSIQSRGALISLKQHWFCARCFVDVLRTRLNRTHNSHMALTRSHNHVRANELEKKQWEMIPPFFP